MRFIFDADESFLFRSRILNSAAEVFISEGYALATFAAIANHAKVGISTVYATFGPMANLLAALIGETVENPVFLGATDVIANAETGPAVIGGLAEVCRQNSERGYAIYELGTQNSHVDPLIGEALDTALETFRHQLAAGVDRLIELGVDDPGQSRAEAADILYFYLGPPAWHSLVDSGWSFPRARDFLADQACRALLHRGRRSSGDV